MRLLNRCIVIVLLIVLYPPSPALSALPVSSKTDANTELNDSHTKLFGILRGLGNWLFGGGGSSPSAPSDRRRGGATRDQCAPSTLPLTALVPAEDSDLAKRYTRTLAEHPTFWFYVPFFPEAQHTVEFVLIDENEQDIYRQQFELSHTPGIIHIQPVGATSTLQTDQLYHWVFSVICNPDNRSGDIAVDGWVKRVEVDDGWLAALAQTNNLRDTAIAYADKQLWHETLNTMIELRSIDPSNADINQAWLDLLTPIGLESIASEPISDCCTVSLDD